MLEAHPSQEAVLADMVLETNAAFLRVLELELDDQGVHQVRAICERYSTFLGGIRGIVERWHPR